IGASCFSHLCQGNSLTGRDRPSPCINGHSSSGLLDNKFNDPLLLLKGEGIKFSLAPNWEEAVYSSFDQVVSQFSKSLHIDLPISGYRSHHGRNDPFRLKIHLYLLRRRQQMPTLHIISNHTNPPFLKGQRGGL